MKKKSSVLNNLLFVTENDYQCTLSQLYHENSKVGRYKFELINRNSEQSIIDLSKMVNGKAKDYSFYEYIDINTCEFAETQRRSKRVFNKKSINITDLKLILRDLLARPSENNLFRRGYPSAGALYPIEIYCIAINVTDCKQGLYYLDAYEHKLMRIKSDVDLAVIQKYFMDEQAILASNLIILMTAVLPRLEIKYGQRGYRYAHLEAGHIAQIILDNCHRNQLGAFPVGGFIEREVEEFLDIDGQEEIALYSIIIGKNNEQNS